MKAAIIYAVLTATPAPGIDSATAVSRFLESMQSHSQQYAGRTSKPVCRVEWWAKSCKGVGR